LAIAKHSLWELSRMPESFEQQVVVSSREEAERMPFNTGAEEECAAAVARRRKTLRETAIALAADASLETVSRVHVQVAEQTMAITPRGKLIRHLGTFGGAVVSLAISMLSNILSGTPATPGRILLTVGAAVIGTLAITIHATRG
jgi:hypothetical protein